MAQRRTTLYAAFFGKGVPAIGVWDFNRRRLETLCFDRRANGESAADERIVRCTIDHYLRVLSAHNIPAPHELTSGRCCRLVSP